MSSDLKFAKLFAGSGAVTLFNALRAFAINKLLAVFLPPAAFACVGQFLNFMSIGSATSSLALQNGWTALTAQNKNNQDKLLGIWRGGLRLTTFASLFTFVIALLFCFMAPLEKFLPGVPTRLAQAAILFALPGILATNIITITAAVMNGLGENHKWALINIVTSVWQVLWVAFFLYTGRLSVLSIIATQSIVAAIFAGRISSRAGFSVNRIWKTALDTRGPWLSYALMGLVPMVLSPVVLTVMRMTVASNFGNDAAGIWQSVWKVSDFLFMAMSAILTVIILPRVSASMNRGEFFKMFNPLLLRIMGISLAMIAVLYFGRSILVQVLFSQAYMGAVDYLPLQLVGDFFRAGGFALALVLIARRETVAFLSVEVGSEFLLAAGTFVGIKFLDFNGPMAAYAFENFVYFVVLYILVRRLKWNTP
ncbi:polysaccharide transporter, PST family [Fibrobacter sp. UWOV1]|uniref:O-antigen translocase n=1 Tax=Fibrobacter sp. UWOV1 TaxID=1896215 RepID=UPI0009107A79|nr:O-antigen translocase [Fibrobacter sp. UWOV1]SHK95250.1 polysaccharide transporter, PST family [Fibrobacter sp. UWOV1]